MDVLEVDAERREGNGVVVLLKGRGQRSVVGSERSKLTSRDWE